MKTWRCKDMKLHVVQITCIDYFSDPWFACRVPARERVRRHRGALRTEGPDGSAECFSAARSPAPRRSGVPCGTSAH